MELVHPLDGVYYSARTGKTFEAIEIGSVISIRYNSRSKKISMYIPTFIFEMQLDADFYDTMFKYGEVDS
jgi:hypothetical protein